MPLNAKMNKKTHKNTSIDRVFVGRDISRGATHIGVNTPSLFFNGLRYKKSVAHSTTLLIGASSRDTESLLRFPKG